MVQDDMVIVLIDQNTNKVLGSIVCDIYTNKDVAELKMLSVLGEYHGKGFGSILHNAAE